MFLIVETEEDLLPKAQRPRDPFADPNYESPESDAMERMDDPRQYILPPDDKRDR